MTPLSPIFEQRLRWMETESKFAHACPDLDQEYPEPHAEARMNWFAQFYHRHNRRPAFRLRFTTIHRGKYMAITSITLIAGVGSVHVTVADQNGDPLPPADITWSGLPDGMTATPDAVGFVFAATASVLVGSTSTTATYNGPGAASAVTGVLTEVVDMGVTSLTFTSP